MCNITGVIMFIQKKGKNVTININNNQNTFRITESD